ncbi:MAG: hypothetical protein AAFU49_00385 [Pseudomonadota bacterium]
MTGPASLLAVAVTVAGQAVLRLSDAKRRRVFSLPARRFGPLRVLARGAVWLPGVALVLLGDVAALVIWMGAATVTGWAIACVTPEHVAGLCLRLTEGASRGVRRLSALRARDARLDALEARVAALEAAAVTDTPRASLSPVAVTGSGL